MEDINTIIRKITEAKAESERKRNSPPIRRTYTEKIYTDNGMVMYVPRLCDYNAPTTIHYEKNEKPPEDQSRATKPKVTTFKDLVLEVQKDSMRNEAAMREENRQRHRHRK